MERSNDRNYISLEEIEANLSAPQTIHGIDDMYNPYVPQQEAQNVIGPPTSNLNTQYTENGISPLVSTTTLQNYEFSAPRPQFSNFVNTKQYGVDFSCPSSTTLTGSPQKEVFDPLAYPIPRISSGQINKEGEKCSSFDSSQSGGTSSLCDQANCANFAAPGMCNDPAQFYCNQDPSYASCCWCPAYGGCPFQPTLDQCQEQYPSDLGIDFCCCPQPSIPSQACTASSDPEAKVCDCCGSDFQDTSRGFSCSQGCTDDEGSSKSLSSRTSKKSVCGSLKNKYSDRAFKMPDPEKRKVRIETASNCSGSKASSRASSRASSKSRCTEAGSTGGGCDPCFPQCPVDPCCFLPKSNCVDIESFLRAQQQQACCGNNTNQCCCPAYVNDVLQAQTVYSTDYRPIMGVCPPRIRQYPVMDSGGCCCQDMFLGGGFASSYCPMSCGPNPCCPPPCDLNPCCPPPCDPNPYCYPPGPSCCPPSCEPSPCCPPSCDLNSCGPPSCCGAGLCGDMCGGHSTGVYGIGGLCSMSTPCCFPLSHPSPGFSGRPTVFH